MLWHSYLIQLLWKRLVHKHDQNTHLDLFGCNCPIKQTLCISISGPVEFVGWEMLRFQTSGSNNVSNVQGRGFVEKAICCCVEGAGFEILKASEGYISATEHGGNHQVHLRRISNTPSLCFIPLISVSAASSFCFFRLVHLLTLKWAIAGRSTLKYPNEPQLCHSDSWKWNVQLCNETSR